jgi:bla regulator protein BlaR1
MTGDAALLESLLHHVWQSTLFAAVAGLLALALKGTHARARYWIWLTASFKFLVPFSVLIAIGSRFPLTIAAPVLARRWVVMEEIRRPLAAPPTVPDYSSGATLPSLAVIVLTVWLFGMAVVLFTWWLKAARLRAVVRAAVPLECGREVDALRRLQRTAGFSTGIQIRSCQSRLEPGVFGIFRPVLLMPSGIADCLDETQLEAIVAHELCHIRNRDNLLAACHMAIEAIFWFHPLIWWLGARLVEEREHACDEEVLRTGSQPEIYAESILKVCRFYLESPMVCVSGVTGADLKKRIESIMTHRAARELGVARKLLLASVGVAAVAVPLAIGMMKTPELGIDSQAALAAPAAFEEVSIKRGVPGSHRVAIRILRAGSFNTTNATLKELVGFAYNLKEHQISGGADWLDSERYDIDARSGPAKGIDEVRAMMRKLLTDRFKVILRHQTKQLPLFEMVIGESGPRFLRVKSEPHKEVGNVLVGRGHLMAPEITMSDLARILGGQVGRTVEDHTGLRGAYAVRLDWTPEGYQPNMPGPRLPDEPPPPNPNGPSLPIALENQLGLKLEPRTGPVETVVIEHAEKVRF